MGGGNTGSAGDAAAPAITVTHTPRRQAVKTAILIVTGILVTLSVGISTSSDTDRLPKRKQQSKPQHQQQHSPPTVVARPVVADGDDVIAGADEPTPAPTPMPLPTARTRQRALDSTPLSADPIRTRNNTGAKARAACRYVFDRYEASPWEQQYYAGIEKYQENVCGAVTGEFRELSLKYKAELPKCTPDKITSDTRVRREVCPQPTKPVAFDDDVFSKMHYRLECDDSAAGQRFKAEMPATETAYIEPLVGMLRHPMYCPPFNAEYGGEGPILGNKNYMVHDEWTVKRNFPFIDHELAERESKSQAPRVFYFDAGATTWSDGESQAWFHNEFNQMCLEIDGGAFVWEVRTFDGPIKALAAVDGRVKPHYHIFNSYCSSDKDSWDNPLNYILKLVEPEDYVVFKLDIDAYKVEKPIIEQMMAHPELTERIDEFYFEHHVSVEPMKRHWWRKTASPEKQVASMRLFTELRKRGVRAHSWV